MAYFTICSNILSISNLSQQRLLGLEVLARWSVLDCLTLNGTYSFVDDK